MKKSVALVAFAIFMDGGSARAQTTLFDELTRYFERIDTMSVTSGDAQQVNAATHIIDPWPHYVGNRRIPADGNRMARAINRYRNPPAPSMSAPSSSGTTATLGAGGSGGLGVSGLGGGAQPPGQ